MRERTTAVWRSFKVSPGTTSARSTTVSTSRPRHARMIRHVRGQARDGHAGARIRRGGAPADVVDDAPRLPGPELAELLGKRRGVGGEPERFEGEHGGRGVMTVRGRGLRGEPRDDH